MKYTTEQILEAIKETKRAGMHYFGKVATMAKKGKLSEATLRQVERDLIELGWLK